MSLNLNQPISCLIVDDEPISHRKLTEYIQRTGFLYLAGAATNAPEAIQLCQQQPNLMFLDIHMPVMDGMELLSALPQPHPLVIITSAHPEYALKGFDYGVVDFLQKPFDFARFSVATQRAKIKFEQNQKETDSTSLGGLTQPETLSIRVGSNQVNIPLGTITYVEAFQNYVKIYQHGKSKPVLSKITLSEIEKKLSDHLFTRIQRKYIVRSDQVFELTPLHIVLFSGEQLSIGISYQESTRKALNRLR